MATTTTKQKLLNQVMTALGRSLKTDKDAGDVPRPVLDQFIFAVLRENSNADNAHAAFGNLVERFFDWNELRVSALEEIVEAFDGRFPDDAERRAQRILDFLQEVFETEFSYELDAIQKKGLKQAAKQLARFHAANDYAVASVIRHSLGGHAIPLDDAALRALRRLSILDVATDDLETLRGSVEHHVPKAKGALLVDLLSELAEAYCWESDPACFRCPLRTTCPTGLTTKQPPSNGSSKRPR